MTSKNKTIKVTPKNILVTGGLGFIGYNVVVRLMTRPEKVTTSLLRRHDSLSTNYHSKSQPNCGIRHYIR